MTDKELRDIHKKLVDGSHDIDMNAAYVKGRNPYILNKAPTNKPDNRIPIPLAKQTVDDMSGYAGRSGDRVAKYEFVSDDVDESDDEFITYIREMDAYNEENIETAELYEEACSQGVAYEIWWSSDEKELPGTLTAEYKIVKTDSVYVQWSDDIKPKMEWFVYFTGDKMRRVASVYYPYKMEQYVSVNSGNYVFNEEGSTEHPYSTPPLNIFPANRDMSPIFEAGKSMIDAYDVIVSRSMNEVERFNSLIAILAEKTSEEFREAFREGAIDIIDDQSDEISGRTDLPRYLQKDFSGINELYKNTLDRLNEDYRKTVKIPDMSDENFGGQQTGIAMAYKLLSLEFMASKIDTYFNKGMIQRLKFYADVYNAGRQAAINVNEYQANVSVKRNMPVDIKSVVEVVVALQTFVSQESLLEYLPNQIVADVQKELARLESEALTRMESMPTLDGIGEEGIAGVGLDVIEDADPIALNGAQVTAAKAIASEVAQGLLPRESGIQLVMALGIPREQAESIVPAYGSAKKPE